MKRRLLMTAAGLSLLPQTTHAQKKPTIGYLSARSLATDGHLLEAFRAGLKEQGFVEGQNVAFEIRWGDGNRDRTEALAVELAALKPDVMVAIGGPVAHAAAKKATSTIPTVFVTVDPVQQGLVPNLNRPGGTWTGAALFAGSLEGKRIDLLREMVPGLRRVGMLMNVTNPIADALTRDAEAAAKALGLVLRRHEIAKAADIDGAFAALSADRPDGLIVMLDSLVIIERRRIVAAAERLKLPAIYPAIEFVQDGGLASYAASWAEMYGVAGRYAGRILKGAKAGELPVQQPTRYELAINLKSAKAMGLTLPPAFLARADETIE
jgi:putative ABC transport system substrate-binding protein